MDPSQIMIDSLPMQNQEWMNPCTLGYDMSSLIDSFSSNYCMCDLLEDYYNSQAIYSSLLDLTCMLGRENSIQKAKNNLSTLKIPKASYRNISDEQLTPSTFGDSPTWVNKLETTFSACSKDTLRQAQTASSAFVGL